MILYFFVIGAIIVSFLILLSPFHRIMYILSIFLSFYYFGLALYTLSSISLPIYYQELNDYMFIDMFSIYSTLVTTLVFCFAAIYAGGYVENLIETGELNRENLKLFYLSFNFLNTFIILAFFSNNMALFLIFAELTTIFGAVLIVTLNAKENIDAAIKYIFVVSSSMVFAFMGMVFLYAITQSYSYDGIGTLNWNLLVILASNSAHLSSSLLLMASVFINIGLMAKAGIAPFHSWLPHAHSMAPSVISTVLSGAVLNVGIYGVIRMYSILRQTSIQTLVSQLLILFGLLSMGIGVFSMLQQRNLKMFIDFSSTEQMGFILIAIGIGTHDAIYWAIFYMLAHSLIKALLFLSAGILHRQYKSNEIHSMINALQLQPIASWGLIIGSVAVVGLPPFILFFPKFLILVQIASNSLVLLIFVLFFFLIAVTAYTIIGTQIFSQMTVHKGLDVIKKYTTPKLMNLPIVVLSIFIIFLGIIIPTGLQNILTNITNELIL